MDNWKNIVLQHIRNTFGLNTFTRKELIEKCMNSIILKCGSIGKTPTQTLSRILQNLRDLGYLTFLNKGIYSLTKSGYEVQDIKEGNKSLGEKLTRDILLELGIPFIEQYPIYLYNRKLGKYTLHRFDFYLPPTVNTNYKAFVIEFDGGQHREPIEYFGGRERYEDTVIKDKMKDRLCKRQGITMIRLDKLKYNYIKDCTLYYLQELNISLLGLHDC